MAAHERLALPHSKGWVDFVDLDDITGGDMRRIRAARGLTVGEAVNAYEAAGCVAFVKAWDVPGKNLPLPRTDPLAIEKLHWADLRVLGKVIGELTDTVLNADPYEGMSGTPQTPATA